MQPLGDDVSRVAQGLQQVLAQVAQTVHEATQPRLHALAELQLHVRHEGGEGAGRVGVDLGLGAGAAGVQENPVANAVVGDVYNHLLHLLLVLRNVLRVGRRRLAVALSTPVAGEGVGALHDLVARGARARARARRARFEHGVSRVEIMLGVRRRVTVEGWGPAVRAAPASRAVQHGIIVKPVTRQHTQ